MIKKNKVIISLILIITILVIELESLAASFELNVLFDGKDIRMESKTTDMSWNLDNFLPGNSDTSSITIKNSGKKTATVQTKISIEEDTGLLEKIDLEVKNKAGDIVFTGKYTEFKNIEKRLTPGESETYTAVTSMNVNAGNEYQNKQYRLKFNFKAIGEIPYGTLTIKYVDENGEDLEPPTIERKKVTSENYNLPQTGKDFMGYRFERVEGNTTGEYKEEGTTIIYHYNKIKYGKLIVKYVDEDGNILEQKEDIKEVGTPYNLDPTGKSFEGYTFEKVEGDITGEYKEKDIIVKYIYITKTPETKTGRLIVKYVDQDGNIIEEEIYTEQVGKNYELEPTGKEIVGYDFVSIEGDYIGKYKEIDTTVSYKYKKRENGKVIIRYVDENETILDEEVTSGIVGYPYEFLEEKVKKDIPEYEFKKIEGELTGEYKKEDTIIFCRYEKVKYGRLIVVCIDENNEVIKRTITTEKVGTEYKLSNEGEEIEGYTFLGVEKDGETEGKYKKEDTIVTYRYKKNKPQGPATEVITLPKTGQFIYIYVILGSIILGILLLMLLVKKKENKDKNKEIK